MKTEISQILSSSDGDAKKITNFNVLVEKCVAAKDWALLKELLDTLLERGGEVAKGVMGRLISSLSSSSSSQEEGEEEEGGGGGMEMVDEDAFVTTCETILQVLQPRLILYEEYDLSVREALATRYVREDNFIGAARVLAGTDTRSARFNDTERCDRLVRIAELFLEDGETVDAEAYVNRASQYVHQVGFGDFPLLLLLKKKLIILTAMKVPRRASEVSLQGVLRTHARREEEVRRGRIEILRTVDVGRDRGRQGRRRGGPRLAPQEGDDLYRPQ